MKERKLTMIKKEFTISSESGLHARPATKLVQQASRYSSSVELQYGQKTVNVKSIMGVMSLGMGQGSKFTLLIDGPDEEEAIGELATFLQAEGITE